MDKKYNKFRRKDQEVIKEKKEGGAKMPEKRCPHCGGIMRFRGPKDCMGTVFWKCRNKKCGRTVDIREDPPTEVIPLVYVDKTRGYNG